MTNRYDLIGILVSLFSSLLVFIIFANVTTITHNPIIGYGIVFLLGLFIGCVFNWSEK